MKKRTSRLLSVLLTLVMVLGMLPAMSITALAANPIYISKIKGTATGLEPVCGTKITAPNFIIFSISFIFKGYKTCLMASATFPPHFCHIMRPLLLTSHFQAVPAQRA